MAQVIHVCPKTSQIAHYTTKLNHRVNKYALHAMQINSSEKSKTNVHQLWTGAGYMMHSQQLSHNRNVKSAYIINIGIM